MAAKLDDKEEKKAFNRKQRQDPNPDRKGKAINVKTEETVVEKAGEKDACYKKVKSRYSVWPSAYASGALVKCRKKGAANWGNKSESVEYSDWRDDFKATEYEFIDIIKAEPLVSEGAMPDAIDPTAHNKARKQKKIRYMTQSPNKNEAEVARRMSKGPSLPMEEFETVDEGQKCWKGYEKKGTKKMFGKVVNNCAKKEGYDVGDVDQKVGAVTPIPKSEQDAARARLLAKAKAKREKMKEEKEESKIDGSNLKKLAAKAVIRVDADVDGDVDTDDMKSPETGEFVPSPDGKKLKPKVRFEGASDWRNELDEGAAWTKKSGKNKKGGLNEKGRKSYEAENPGSDLKAPSKKKGNKRRASFCARMKGMKKKLTSAKTARDPDSRINKSLRSWNC